MCAIQSNGTKPRAGPNDTPKQAIMFKSRCDGWIDTNGGEGKAGSPEENQDSGGPAISQIHHVLLFPQTITNLQN
jgi:hypothetical protein